MGTLEEAESSWVAAASLCPHWKHPWVARGAGTQRDTALGGWRRVLTRFAAPVRVLGSPPALSSLPLPGRDGGMELSWGGGRNLGPRQSSSSSYNPWKVPGQRGGEGEILFLSPPPCLAGIRCCTEIKTISPLFVSYLITN